MQKAPPSRQILGFGSVEGLNKLDQSNKQHPHGSYKDVILAGDVGGTNSRFMLYEADLSMHPHSGHKPPGKLIFQRQYPNEGVTHFVVQLKRFLADANRAESPPAVACIAMAGPVTDNTCLMTNRGWVINGYELGLELGIRNVRLVNDFVAAGYGLLTLNLNTEVRIVQEGSRRMGAPIACIGSGTGLGEVFLTAPRGSEVYDAFPTEGGHGEVAARDDLEWELITWMKKRIGCNHVSTERIVSGIGLVNVYEFLAERFPERVDAEVHASIMAAGDLKGKIISEGAATKGSICEQVLQVWASHYGGEAGSAALKYLPFGGLFLAGGMTPKLIDWIIGEDSPFMKAFLDQGRVTPMVASIPVYAVLEEDIGQRGAHFVAFSMYRSYAEEQGNTMMSTATSSAAGTASARRRHSLAVLAIVVAAAAAFALGRKSPQR